MSIELIFYLEVRSWPNVLVSFKRQFPVLGFLRGEGFSENEIDELLAAGLFSVMMIMTTDTYIMPWEQPFSMPEEDHRDLN